MSLSNADFAQLYASSRRDEYDGECVMTVNVAVANKTCLDAFRRGKNVLMTRRIVRGSGCGEEMISERSVRQDLNDAADIPRKRGGGDSSSHKAKKHKSRPYNPKK